MTKNIETSYEIKIYQYGLMLALVMLVLQLINSAVTQVGFDIWIQQVFFLGFLAALRVFLWRSSYGIFAFHIFVFASIVLSWSHFGGWNGRLPYAFMIIYIFIVATTHGAQMFGTLALFTAVLFSLTWFLPEVESKGNLLESLSVEFIIQMTILAVILCYMRIRFSKLKEGVKGTTQQLEEMERHLLNHKILVERQHEELMQARDSLEKLVQGKSKLAQSQKDQLQQFKHLNSHVLRAPIARILSLLYVLEQDKDSVSFREQRIKDSTLEIDKITKHLYNLLEKEDN